MIVDVIEEIIRYKLHAPDWVKSKYFTIAKIALILISVIIPYSIDLHYVILWPLLVTLFIYSLGLRKTILYAVISMSLLFFLSLLPIALVLGGNIERVIRSSIVAYTTMATSIFLIASTPPTAFKGHPSIYLFFIILSSVFREVIDISLVMKSKGLSGPRYYASVIVTSFVMAFERIEQLIDSLRVRGIEVT